MVLGPRLRRGGLSAIAAVLLGFTAQAALAQERGAVALGEAVQSLGVNTRVLVVGAHPDDEDTFLISWLSRGRHVETAYLSLTRGDGGQNLIGNELGEALGVIRTEELLAARRVDGAQQFFTRAFDFGFSKDTIDTYEHWPRDSILGDVVRVVRAFRPHVVVAVFSGTPRDGHGHHQVSGLLARAAYEVAGDTTRFPAREYGAPWTPHKFYRNARYDPTLGVTLRFDVGEYSPLLGMSYAEIAGQSRSQHKSQGFGAPQRKGSFLAALRREATRVNESAPATDEQSIFDGIDTTWHRFQQVRSAAGAVLDSLPAAFLAAREAFQPFAPSAMLPALGRVQRLLEKLQLPSDASLDLARDLDVAVRIQRSRIDRALRLASGVEVEVFAERELRVPGQTGRVAVTVYNRGTDSLALLRLAPGVDLGYAGQTDVARTLAPGAALTDTFRLATDLSVEPLAGPYWLRTPRKGALFTQPISLTSETELPGMPSWFALSRPLINGGAASLPNLSIVEPVVVRVVDPVKGEMRHRAGLAPAIAITVDQETQYVPANTEFTRDLTVRVRSAADSARDVHVSLVLPAGLTADSAARTVRLERYGASQMAAFRLRGRVPPGLHSVEAIAESGGETFRSGYQLIDYDHIRRQRIYRRATTALSAVDMRVPATLRVAYVRGVGDNVAPALVQLGIPVTLISAAELARADLQPYTTLVIGPRAYEAHPELAAANTRVFDFARAGGTVVVQYGQTEMTRPGVMPHPVTLTRPAARVAEEDAPVTIEAPEHPLLRAPNRIDSSDFSGWVQERALYMPMTFDDRYRALLSMHDTGEPANRAAILVTPLGRGQYIYTTLSFFRQLPAGVPGGARLFLNLLSASLPMTAVNP
jgi:LmbE family N-acetylglucosaminyl deacetylase